jgi:hypothetical protein
MPRPAYCFRCGNRALTRIRGRYVTAPDHDLCFRCFRSIKTSTLTRSWKRQPEPEAYVMTREEFNRIESLFRGPEMDRELVSEESIADGVSQHDPELARRVREHVRTLREIVDYARTRVE